MPASPLYDNPDSEGNRNPRTTRYWLGSTQSLTQQSQSLAVLDKFHTLLAKAETLQEVTDLRSKADAVRVWAKSAAMGLEAQNRAAELKLRAERKAGELLANLKLRGGNRKSNGHDDRLNLNDLGINQSQSKRWQKEATVPETDFESYIKQASKFGEEVTAAGLLRLCRRGTAAGPQRRGHALPQERQEIVSRNQVVRLHAATSVRSDQNDPDPNRTQRLEVVQEICDHYALLCSLLVPVCEGTVDDLLPIQRQAVRHYLAETGRLLALLRATEQERRPGRLAT